MFDENQNPLLAGMDVIEDLETRLQSPRKIDEFIGILDSCDSGMHRHRADVVQHLERRPFRSCCQLVSCPLVGLGLFVWHNAGMQDPRLSRQFPRHVLFEPPQCHRGEAVMFFEDEVVKQLQPAFLGRAVELPELCQWHQSPRNELFENGPEVGCRILDGRSCQTDAEVCIHRHASYGP